MVWSIDPISEGHTHATISNCILQGNRETCGTVIYACDGAITNCLIADNNSRICVCICPSIEACHGLIKNCTIANSTNGVAIGVYDDCITTVQNCIIYNKHKSEWPQIMVGQQGILNISYCYLQDDLNDVQGTVIWGPGNIIDSDPCFVRLGHWEYIEPNLFFYEGNYHLQSTAGRWDPNSNQWVTDANTSDCIDAGDMASPIGYEPFPNGGIINMGAYGGTAEASKSYFGEPICETIVAGDINGDCTVDFKDFAFMAYHWLENNNP